MNQAYNPTTSSSASSSPLLAFDVATDFQQPKMEYDSYSNHAHQYHQQDMGYTSYSSSLDQWAGHSIPNAVSTGPLTYVTDYGVPPAQPQYGGEWQSVQRFKDAHSFHAYPQGLPAYRGEIERPRAPFAHAAY